jgi:hypothetical protein
MIDYFALALGHGLMAFALLRLVLRGDVDADPLLARLKADTAANRMASSASGRNAARREQAHNQAPPETRIGPDGDLAPQPPATKSRAQAARR